MASPEFNSAEEAYIEACVEMLKISEIRTQISEIRTQISDAYARALDTFDDASALVAARGEALDSTKVHDLEYMRELVTEARKRGGWEDDSEIAKSLDEGYEVLKKVTASIDAATLAAANADQPVL